MNRVTDVRLHDDPWMRFCGVRGLKVETAGQSGQNAGSEGDLIGVVDAVAFRDAILRQRQLVLGGRRRIDASCRCSRRNADRCQRAVGGDPRHSGQDGGHESRRQQLTPSDRPPL